MLQCARCVRGGLVGLVCLGLFPVSVGAQPKPRDGELPTTADGRPLNFDFEKGTLDDWQAEGAAFAKQPIKGDTVAPRRGDMKSEHAGSYWIGTYEVGGDAPQGTLTSVPFVVKQPYASFLVAGGEHNNTCVELVRKDSGKVITRVSGTNTENLRPVAVDLSAHVGQEIFIRLVDKHSGGWGHINFDDFRFHAQKPNYPAPEQPPQPDVYVHAGLSPLEAAKAMTVPKGFSVTLFAGEPDVQQPIAMALDDRGRLWIAEAYVYPIKAPPDQGRDRILIFEDTDGDGRFDAKKVFLDRLNLVSGLEVGFGGVWVGQAPELLFIPDKNGDDVPDGPPQVLLDGWGYHDTHETLNAFLWGPDGWLYGCHGVFTHSRVGKPGTPDEQRIPINAGIWRYHPTRHEFEVFAHGTSNPWGVDFNDHGQAFLTACVIPHLYHVIQGGRYQRQAGQHFNPYTYDDIKTIAVHRHYLGATPHGGNGRSDAAGGGHAHAGAMIYLGGKWPQEYRDQIFMNNIHGARLNQDALSAQGSGYVGNRAPDFLLANDQWSQILYLTYGPDGDVFFIDWYDKNQCHHGNVPGHDRTNGRIFKVSYGDSKSTPVDLTKKTDQELVALQLHSNDWYVRHARRLLQERGPKPEVHAALDKIAFGNAADARRLRGLWALHATGGLTDERALRALADASPYVRAWAVQLVHEKGAPSPAVSAKLYELAQKDESPVVRLYLASASQRTAGATAEHRLKLLQPLLGRTEDASDHNLPLMYWYAAEALASAHPQVGVLLLNSAKLPLVRGYLVRRLTQTGDPAVINGLLANVVANNQDPADLQLVLNEMLIGLRGRRNLPLPTAWSDVARKLSQSEVAAVRNAAGSLSLTFGDPAVLAARTKLVADAQAPAADRKAALDSLLAVNAPGLAPVLRDLLGSAEMAGPAVRGLAQYDDPATPAALLAAYGKFDPATKRDALNTLGSRAEFALALLRAVDARQIPSADLSADLIRQIRSLKHPEIDALITKAWGTVRDTPADKAQLIARTRQLLNKQPSTAVKPDLTHGRMVFAKTCQQCHVLFDVGRKVGPDLTGSNRANLDYLLANLIDPSAIIGKDYQVQVIVTAAGRTLNGIVKAEDPQSLTLLTANEEITLAKSDIEERVVSEKSMMPDDLVRTLGERDLRSLVAYLASPQQVPLPVQRDTPAVLFNGKDLTGWKGDPAVWSVENGEIVGKTATGLKRNEFLVSDLLLDDFRLELEIQLVGDAGNSGVQIRSEPLPNGEMRGYQADVGPGWWGKLYEESGRALLWDKSGEEHVRKGEWNKYEIVAVGSRVQTFLNGQPCVDLEDPPAARRGVIGLQVHSGGPTEVRFRNLQLTVLPSKLQPAPGGQFLSTRPARPTSDVKFKKTTLDGKFRSEGVAMGDFNNDGLLDVAAGSVWYAAPDWKMHSLLEQPAEFSPKTYSNTFCNWAEDLDGDGRQDLIVVDFPGQPTWWFRNPGRAGGPWQKQQMVPVTNNESPTYLDVDLNGTRELLYGDAEGRMCLARPGSAPDAPWEVFPISLPKAPSTEKFSHGLGVGDINRDGRNDVLVPQGWWEGPSLGSSDPWAFHKAPFGEAQAQMHVFDFDGDGDSDVVGSSAHRRGIWWYEQTPDGWKTELIDQSIAQTHALCLADINGDGLPDLVTGKRYYAHNGRDPGEDEPPYLSWFELTRENGRPKWIQHVIDEDSGVGTCFEVYDLNADGRLDVIVANKRGVFVLTQE